jgi:hypothetical protein
MQSTQILLDSGCSFHMKRGDGMLPSFCFTIINITCIYKTELTVTKIIKIMLKRCRIMKFFSLPFLRIPKFYLVKSKPSVITANH